MPINNLTWNRIRYTFYAPLYNIIRPLFLKARKRSIQLLEAKPGEKILILGCGTGLDLEFLPEHCELVAVDLTPAMVERTATKAKELDLNLVSLVMDAHQLEFDSATFDAVVLHLILAVVPDPFLSAKEVGRVLKPGGRACILDKFISDDEAPNKLRKVLNGVTNTVFSDINRQLGPILKAGELKIIHQEDSLFSGAFKISIVQKAETVPD